VELCEVEVVLVLSQEFVSVLSVVVRAPQPDPAAAVRDGGLSYVEAAEGKVVVQLFRRIVLSGLIFADPEGLWPWLKRLRSDEIIRPLDLPPLELLVDVAEVGRREGLFWVFRSLPRT